MPSKSKFKYILEENDEDDKDDKEEPDSIKIHNNHIYLYSDVEKGVVLELNHALKELENKLLIYSIQHDCEPAPIYLHINSDGGDIFSALSTVDTIRNIKVPVHSIIEGCAASAATLISVVCDKRTITKYSHMLIHQLSSSFWGKMNEIEDEMKNLNRLMIVIKDIYKTYSKLNLTCLSTCLKKDILWDSNMCLKHGLVDMINE